MRSFTYTARDHSGAPATGILVANTAAEVSQMLRADGKYPTSIKAATDAPDETASPSRRLRMSRKDLIQLATQLEIMIETGVTVSDALESIASQAQKPNVKQIVRDISAQVQAGSDFSTALQRYPRAFPRLFIALMSASEKSGMMAKLLHRGTEYLRDEYQSIRRVRGALTYPGIMLLFAISTTTFLLAFVMPRFTAIYAQKQAALPGPTKFLMAISGFIVGQWPWIILTILVVGGSIYFALRTPQGARTFHFLQLRVPLLGGIFRKLYLSRGLRMVGTMANAGINLVDCVKTAHSLCDNSYFRDLWNEVSEQIHIGKQVSEPMFHSSLVPHSVAQMLQSAEKSGKLAQVMEQVAGFEENELKENIADLTRYIEPIMIVIMGAIIGTVALALMLPIFTISKVLAK
jgi:type IV pilus assembly protein PilC